MPDYHGCGQVLKQLLCLIMLDGEHIRRHVPHLGPS